MAGSAAEARVIEYLLQREVAHERVVTIRNKVTLPLGVDLVSFTRKAFLRRSQSRGCLVQLRLRVRQPWLVDFDIRIGFGEVGIRCLLANKRLAVLGPRARLVSGSTRQLAVGFNLVGFRPLTGRRPQPPSRIENAHYL